MVLAKKENKKIYVVLPPNVVGKFIRLNELGKYKIVLVENEYIILSFFPK
jgi:hypothetical protein